MLVCSETESILLCVCNKCFVICHKSKKWKEKKLVYNFLDAVKYSLSPVVSLKIETGWIWLVYFIASNSSDSCGTRLKGGFCIRLLNVCPAYVLKARGIRSSIGSVSASERCDIEVSCPKWSHVKELASQQGQSRTAMTTLSPRW